MDARTLEQLRAHLMETDPGFRRLAEQHSEYDSRLRELGSRHYLTEEEKLEEVRLKKLKLRLKDQMQEMLDQQHAQRVN